jgi:hypothetical protein
MGFICQGGIGIKGKGWDAARAEFRPDSDPL